MLLVIAALGGVMYLVSKDYFAIATIVIIGLVVGFVAGRKPQQVAYELSASGLRVGPKLYPHGIFKSFAIVMDGALNSILLVPVKRFMPPVSVYYAAADEEKIVDILGNYLPYEDRGLDAIDRLTRRLHF